MSRRHDCRPCVLALEERVVMTLSLSGLLHSVLPFIKDNTAKAPAVKHGVAVQGGPSSRFEQHQQAVAARRAAVVAARHPAAPVAPAAARVAVTPTPAVVRATGVGPTRTQAAATPVTMYGPYLGAPGSYRRPPGLVVRNPSTGPTGA